MNTRTALLRDIARRRFDMLPRLALADYLDEHPADPTDALTAEFVRVGVELASGGGANVPGTHRPSASCDCVRCKLTRRQAELFDVMAHVGLLRESGFERIGFNTTISPTEYAGGFPAVFRSWWAGLPLTGLPLAVSRVFLCLPVNFMTANFSFGGTRRNRAGVMPRVTWQVSVSVTDATSTRGGRVVATVGPIVTVVGPVVGQVCRPVFACEYPVSAASRVPTLIRKAVRRCLTNRTGNGERRGIVVTDTFGEPDPAEVRRVGPAARPITRRRGRR